jgi:hypothetical protein
MNAPNEIIPASSEDNIFSTQFHSLHEPVVKLYGKDFSKTAAANMIIAEYQRYRVSSLHHFDEYLKQMTPHDTITLGVTVLENGISKTAAAIRRGESGIYRGTEHIKYLNTMFPACSGNEYSLYFFDIDYDSSMPSHFKMDTPDEVRSSLMKLIPALEYAAMLIKPSSSANIYNSETGVNRSEFPSWHIYITVANSTDETNKNLTEYIKRRAWRSDVNLGYAKVNGTGVVERYYTDLAVASAERIIIEAAPFLEVPLMKKYVPSTIYEGGILDLSKINYEDEPDYRDIYAKQKQLLLPNTVLQGNGKTKISSTNINTPSVKSGKAISISLSVEQGVMDIYNYLRNTKKAEAKEVMRRCNDQIVSVLLTFFGYEIDANFKFKIRDEKTASASIRFDGLIKDFGGTFSGNIINFIMEFYQLSFLTSWHYLQACFGKKQKLSIANRGALPNPSDFEKILQLK